MEFVIFVLGFIAIAVVAPIAIVAHFAVRWRTARGLTAEEERTVADLYTTAETLKTRVANLEKLLDETAPGWRNGR